MTKVITYGTYDLLHYGHQRLLERAKALGDYLVVGVTSDDFDRLRGKINSQQSLTERMDAVRATGLADEIIVEEYEGQKIDDIRRMDIDIFTVGSDWVGKFDYLNEYCKVVYLPRTEGISSTEVRQEQQKLRLGIVGEPCVAQSKFIRECGYVNGIELTGVVCQGRGGERDGLPRVDTYQVLLEQSEAIYLRSHPREHQWQIKQALLAGKHVLCGMPISLGGDVCEKLFELADEQKVVLMEANKTAYCTAYSRLLNLAKSGRVGKIVSVDATCTSLTNLKDKKQVSQMWSSMCEWGPAALLPIFQLLGTDYTQKQIVSCQSDAHGGVDIFSKVSFIYANATATMKVGRGIKSEGDLVVSGTEGYIYVPAPWWKTDYFELRYEDPANNKRCFYQLEGEGIRYEIINFLKTIKTGKEIRYIDRGISIAISDVVGAAEEGKGVQIITL